MARYNVSQQTSSLMTALCVLVAQSCPALRPHGLQFTSLLCPWNSPGKNVGVGCHLFLQEISPAQGSNPSLLQYRQVLYHLSHQESPQIDYFITVLEMLHLLPAVNMVEEDYSVRERITAREWSKITAILEVKSQIVFALNA